MVLSEVPMILSEVPMVLSEVPVILSEVPVILSEVRMVLSEVPMALSEVRMVLSEMPTVRSVVWGEWAEAAHFWLESRAGFAVKKGIVNDSGQSLLGKWPFTAALMNMHQHPESARLDARDRRYARLMGEFINERRCWLKMSQEQVAQKAGLSRTEIHNIEHGQTGTRVTTMMRVCEALDMSYPELAAHLDYLMTHPRRQTPGSPLKTRRGKKNVNRQV